MDKKLYIANWKSHKNLDEAIQFFEDFKNGFHDVDLTGKELIIAPPFTLLMKCRQLVDENNLPIKLAGQNVSPFPKGAYTGEINASQLKEFAQYVIIGHSERRRYMHENESDIENKVREATEAGLAVIQCIQDEKSAIHKGAAIIAYEPPSAIGSGNPDEPEHIEQVFKTILESNPDVKVLYGGSVAPENISSFKSIESLSGFLVGGASLDAHSFLSLL